MNKIYNILLVSNSISWSEQFKRVSQLNEIINVVGIARGIHDFKVRFSNAPNIHAVIISDEIVDGTLADLLTLISNLDVVVFGIIKQEESAVLLESYNLSYEYEKDKAPFEIIEFLQESLPLVLDDSNSQAFEEVEYEKVETQPSRFAEITEMGIEQNKQRNSISGQKQAYHSYDVERGQNEVEKENIQRAQPRPQGKRGVTTMGVLKPKVVCFTSAKGGVGKSAIAIEVASCIAARAKEVDFNMASRGSTGEVNAVLVDLNCAFGTIASTLPCVSDMKNPPTLGDWVIRIEEKIKRNLSSEDKLELQSQEIPKYARYIYKMSRNALRFTKNEVLELLVKDPKTGLYVLPTIASNFDIANIENEFIEIIIQELSQYFEAVILDTGNNFEGFTQTAFRMSHEIYVVAQPNYQVSQIIKNLLRDSIDGLGIDYEKFKLIINHPQTNKQVIDDDGMVRALGIPLAGGISHDENMLLAHDKGNFYVINNKKKAVSRDITLIANQICPLWNVAGAVQKGGFMQKLFGSK